MPGSTITSVSRVTAGGGLEIFGGGFSGWPELDESAVLLLSGSLSFVEAVLSEVLGLSSGLAIGLSSGFLSSVFAGLSPFTQEGEATGSRNEYIQWIQDVYDQRGIVRQYMKYDNEIRTARNVKQIIHRSLQIAHSDPKGPVYIVGAREVMEE